MYIDKTTDYEDLTDSEKYEEMWYEEEDSKWDLYRMELLFNGDDYDEDY
jgi:hypothetical protein